MERADLHIKVRNILDEVELTGVPTIENSVDLTQRIESVLVESLRVVLLNAKLYLLKAKDIQCKVEINQDGSGQIKLPDDFLRLAEFKMECWKRTIFNTINEHDHLYRLQDSLVTRGGTNKPIVAVTSDKILQFWSVPAFMQNAVCEKKTYIPDANYFISTSDIKIDPLLDEILAYIVAKNIAVTFGSDTKFIDIKINELLNV